MNKITIIVLAPFTAAILLSACVGTGLKETRETYGAKFTGEHSALARCVVDKLQSDSRWLIRALQYDIRRYPRIEATEIRAYAPGILPGIYPRNSPDNPDAVISYASPPHKVHVYKSDAQAGHGADPNYSFLLMLKRTDPETVVATLNGKRHESGVAWEKLKACSPG
ncbi:MAG: hypothetical protein H0X43_10490 [Nitrosospira sp.]|nr:hypothetical protein [Nitrosospira sp.]